VFGRAEELKHWPCCALSFGYIECVEPGDIVKLANDDRLYWYFGRSGPDAFIVPLKELENNRYVRLSSEEGLYVRADELLQDSITASVEVLSEEES
jgi:hypothetical protein